jgi:DNA-binding transcriptional ArsR family regulator
MTTPPGVAFEALADSTRREVVELLALRPRRAGELAASAGVSAPAMSRHLRILLSAGMIVDERSREDARLRVFRLRPEGLSGLDSWLDELKSRWGHQLRSFQQYTQERGRQ